MAAEWVIPVATMVGTIFAGVGLKVVEGLLSRAKEKDASAKGYRDELRTELTAVKAERDSVEEEMIEWRRKYYELLERFMVVSVQLNTATEMLRQLGATAPIVPTIPDSIKKDIAGS